MSKTRRLFQPYPAYRYKQGEKPRLVHNQNDDATLLNAGWAKTPVKEIMEQMPEDIKNNPQVMEKMGDVTSNIAAMVNMLARVDKVRSKKDLRWLAAELGIELPGDGYSLKQLRKLILDEARIHPDFAKHLTPEPPSAEDTIQ